MRVKLKKLWAVFFVFVALSGCNATTRYIVQIDSISSPNQTDRVGREDGIAYRLIPGNEGLSRNDIQYLEYAEYVKRALNEHKFYEGRIPDLIIGFSYGISGPIQRVSPQGGIYDVYERYIILAGFSPIKTEGENDIRTAWKTTIKSTGSSGDLRRVFPVMLGAALPYISNNTSGQITVEIDEESQAVKLVKGREE